MATVLIVEHDAGVAEVLNYALNLFGHNAVSYNNTTDASSMLNEQLPQLLMLEACPGDDDGRKLCAQLKKDERYKHIPVLITSSWNIDEQDIYTCQPDAYMPMPFDLQQLQTTVQMLLATGAKA